MDSAAVHRSEVALHDQWANGEVLEKIDIHSCMEGVNAVENRYIMACIQKKLGGLDGLRILDAGSGLGESSVYFASRGALVTATDISQGMIDFCKRLGEAYGVADRIQTLQGEAESIPLPDDHYDVVYAANLVHHLTDIDSFLAATHRCLKPGGLLCTWDPLRYNPIINVYRRIATAVRTPGEQPVDFALLRKVKRYFPRMAHREFWFFSLGIFIKFYLIDRLDPNMVRYWKHVHEYGSGVNRVIMQMLHGLDRVPLSIPLLNRLAWSIAVVAQKS